ncbi:MAG: hypothetical protein V1837_05580 [Candidatus Woesearchaeota archaeon]
MVSLSRLVLISIILLFVGLIPSVISVDVGTGTGISMETEKFPPMVWMCDHRIVLDDNVEPGRISGGGTELIERIENYAFEGEQIQWDVLVMDKNGIEKVKDVYVTVGTSTSSIEANCQVLSEVTGIGCFGDPSQGSCSNYGMEQCAAVDGCTTVCDVYASNACDGLTPCYSTIQAAIDAAEADDTVCVLPGTYDESQILINKALRVLGSGPAVTIIDGGSATNLAGIGLVRITAAANVEFSGFTLRNAGVDPTVTSGGFPVRVIIYAQSASSSATYTITDNHLFGSNDPLDEQDYGFYSNSGLETLIFTYNSITQTGANAILLEMHAGPTDVSFNTWDRGVADGSVDSYFNMNYGGSDITTLQKVSNNIIDMGTGTDFDSAHRGFAITFAGDFTGAASQGGYTNVEISGNRIINLRDYRRGIGLWNNAPGTGAFGNINAPLINDNTIIGVPGSVGGIGIRLLGLVTNAVIGSNQISNMDTSFLGAAYNGHIATGTTVNQNNLLTSITGFQWDGVPFLDATNNYWGCATGPNTGTCELTVGNINSVPYASTAFTIDSVSVIDEPTFPICSGTPTSCNQITDSATCDLDPAGCRWFSPDRCNARILEESITEFNPQDMAYYACTFTVETPFSMHGEYWVTVEAEDLDGLFGDMDEREYWFLNPEIALSIQGAIDFGTVRPGALSYSDTLLVGNAAEDDSGVMLDMYIAGTDFYDPSSSGAKCPDTNQLALTNFAYFATNGAYSTLACNSGTALHVHDAEGYVAIPYGNRIDQSQEIIGCEPFANSPIPGGDISAYQPGNVLSPGAEIAMTFRLALPEPCNGDFSEGSIMFWGEAV